MLAFAFLSCCMFDTYFDTDSAGEWDSVTGGMGGLHFMAPALLSLAVTILQSQAQGIVNRTSSLNVEAHGRDAPQVTSSRGAPHLRSSAVKQYGGRFLPDAHQIAQAANWRVFCI